MNISNLAIAAAKKHFSLFLIGMGSLAMLGSNVLFEKFLDPVQYGQYSLFVTYISTIYIFGFLGLEQVLLRLSGQESIKVISLNRTLLVSLAITGLGFCLFASYIYIAYFSGALLNYFKIFIISLSAVFSMLVFSFNWITACFSTAQLVANLWKFLLASLAILGFVGWLENPLDIFDGFYYFAIIQLVILTISCFRLKFKMDLRTSLRTIGEYWFHFFVATALLTLILFFDRYFIKDRFGLVAFGEYFYLASIFLMPFGLLQNYVGFKNLIVFKSAFDWAVFSRHTFKHFLFTIFSGGMLLVATYLLDYLHVLNIDFGRDYLLIVLFIVLGVIRVLFGIAAAAVGARVKVANFRMINLFSVIMMGILIILAFYLVVSVLQVLVLMILLWLSRTVLYLISLRLQFK